MPIDVQMPDGTIISGVPDNITQADLMARYKAFVPPPPEAAGFSAKDTALALSQGVVGAGKSLVDVFGADTSASRSLADIQKDLSERYSSERQAEMARREAMQKQASKGTLGEEISTFLGGVAEAPVQSLAQGLGSIVPYVGTGIIGGIAKLGGATVKAINTVVGAAQGAGAVKGSIYDGVKQELQKSGMSEQEAAAKAAKAQEYLGENFLDIIGGSALGGLGARVGVENLLTPGAGANLSKQFLARTGRAALAEAPLEGAQGAQEQLAINRALQKQGFDVGTFEGVAGAAARDAAVGAMTGATVGGIRSPGADMAAPPAAVPPESVTPAAMPPEARPVTPAESQDTQAMIDEFRNIGMPPAEVAEPTVAEPAAPLVAEPVPAAEIAPEITPEIVPVEQEVAQPAAVKPAFQEKFEQNKAIEAELKDLYKERNKLSRVGDNLIPWLKKYGVNPNAKADMGIEKGDRRLPVGIFKKSGLGLDELARAAVNDGVITEQDLARQPDEVEAFRELVYDALQGNVSQTPFNLENMAKLNAIESRIEQLERPEQPESFDLQAETAQETEARLAQEAEKKKLEDDKFIQAEMDAQAERDRAEIASQSVQQSKNFTLGQTPQESLTGQQRLDDDIPFFSMERSNAKPYTRQVLNAERLLNEKIDELKRLNIRRTAIKTRFETERTKPIDQLDAVQLRKRAKLLEDEIDSLKWETKNNSAEKFLARAAKGLADEEIDKDVYDTINLIYQKDPNLLEGLKLQVRQGVPPSDLQSFQAAGEFIGRIVRLYKDTSGVTDPSVVRHELTHSLEQVMSKDVKKKLVQEWRNALDKAQNKEKTPAGKAFFSALLKHLDNPTKESFTATTQMMPDKGNYYQFMSPSEYWAVNAENLLDARLGGAWDKFKNFVRGLYESLKDLFGFDNKNLIHKTFNEVMKGKREGINMLADMQYGVTPKYSMEKTASGEEKPNAQARNYLGKQIQANWAFPEDNIKHWPGISDQSIDNFLYKIQDKQIDTKRAQQAIEKAAGEIEENINVYEKEQLYHGRTATGIRKFLLDELMPAIKELGALKLTPQDLKDYLYNRHAEERNNKMNEVNKLDPITGKERKSPWELQDRASGISTKDARAYLANLEPAKKAALEKVAKRFDEMVQGTQQILLNSGAEDKATIDAYNNTYKHYVPLFRIENDFTKAGGMGATGASKGFGVRGAFSKRAMGSEKEVQDILGNLIAQRERALIRAEKSRVGQALYGLALTNPNPDLWLPVNPDAIKSRDALVEELQSLGYKDAAQIADNLMEEPKSRYISKEKKQFVDPDTGLPMQVTEESVKLKLDNLKRFGDNVFPVRINGKDRYIFFNKNDPKALRMVHSLMNLDADSLGGIEGLIAKLTRWFASVNTQYNPIFGVVNLIRDIGGSTLNLSTTAIAGDQAKVNRNVIPAMRGILNVLRDERKGKTDTKGKWAKAFQDFREQGGQTGYRDSLIRTDEEKQIIEREINKMKSGNTKKAFYAVVGALSDFNDMMENSIRVAAYMAALDKGLSKQKAAILAKNLTVNFDKKGQLSSRINAYFAFFNASVQGTARLAKTLKGPKGKAIIGGGIALGAAQAVILAMAGYDDDNPPEFIRERNFIVPLPFTDGDFLTIPYPLGFNVLPNVGRLTTEFVLSGGKDPGKKVTALLGSVVDAFSPIGGSELSLQTIMPTVADPIVAIATNKDAFGRPIYKKDQATNPTPGYLRSRENASEISKNIAYFLNLASFGTKYSKGYLSPTGDEIDYLIGQITGGVGRELIKAEQTVKSGITGEELPAYRIPLVGRFYGETQSNAAESQRFYDNIIKMADYENEVKGRIKNKEPVAEYLRENPQARFWQTANNVENQINALNKQKKEFIEKGLPKDRIKRIENQKAVIMKRFNDQLAQYEE
jgi:hypothetical protein